MTPVAHYVKLTSLTHKQCKSQTNTALGLQNCLKILKVDTMKETHGYDDKGILYHINRENEREYKATVIPKTLVNTILKEMYHITTLVILVLINLIHLSKGTTTGLR